jgi:hypothetical protein
MNTRSSAPSGATWRRRFLAIARQAEGAVAAAERAGAVGLRARARVGPFVARRLRLPPFPLRAPFQG